MASETTVKDRAIDETEVALDVDAADPSDSTTTKAARKSAPLRARSSRRRGRLLLGVLLAALVAATGFFGYHYFADSSASGDADRIAVTAIADDYTTKLASFDYRDLNKNREQITAMSTSSFSAKYDEMVKALTEIVSNGQGVATAKASHVAVQSIDGDTATVIAFVDQKATNVVAPTGKDQAYRMVLTMKRDGDTWLVDDVQTV
ncbi:hypothetical protein [Gordonia hydrophobica]|uniref:Mce-associated membrane protein n=1 Tax=Gordonia hydrophobica TaxID=40516 RepID=A0ABZ2U301_9ACTN|nr:hypothetical protein [Gordonia hydrophobica]MBM7367274.1 Mce-associated membrane protein [Gordonia hydrophobica]